MNDEWIKGASLPDIMALDTYAHLIPPVGSPDRDAVIRLVARWKFAIDHLHEAFVHEQEVLPMLQKKYGELQAQLAHKRKVYDDMKEFEGRVIDSIKDAIRKLEKQTTEEVKRNEWGFWKNEARQRIAQARANLNYFTAILDDYERTGKLRKD